MSNDRYQHAFPSYDGILPELAGWDDVSWENDVCPSLSKHIADEFGTVELRLFVDFMNPERREFPSHERFRFCVGATAEIEFGTTLELYADTLEGLRGVAMRWFLDNVGDSILEADLTTAQILEEVGMMVSFHSMNKATPEADHLSELLGRHIIETGGGCKAYSFDHGRHYVWITDTSGCTLPNEGGDSLLGVRFADGAEGSVIEAKFDAKRVLGFLRELGVKVDGTGQAVINLPEQWKRTQIYSDGSATIHTGEQPLPETVVAYVRNTNEERLNLMTAAPALLMCLEEARLQVMELCGAAGIPYPDASLERYVGAIKQARGEF